MKLTKHPIVKWTVFLSLLASSFALLASVTMTPIPSSGNGIMQGNPPNYTIAWTANGATQCGKGPQVSPYKIEGHHYRGSLFFTDYSYGQSKDIYVPPPPSVADDYIYKVYAYQCDRYGNGAYIYSGEIRMNASSSGNGGGTGTGGGGTGGGNQNGTPPPNVTFVHTDLLGSPVAETDENGDRK